MSIEIRRQLFNLTKLNLNELRTKWYNIFKSNPPCYKKGLLLKELLYKIQSLYYTDIHSEGQIGNLIKIEEKEIVDKSHTNTNKITIIPLIGTVIKKIYRNREYYIKIHSFGCSLQNNWHQMKYGKLFSVLVRDKKDFNDINLIKKVG